MLYGLVSAPSSHLYLVVVVRLASPEKFITISFTVMVSASGQLKSIIYVDSCSGVITTLAFVGLFWFFVNVTKPIPDTS